MTDFRPGYELCCEDCGHMTRPWQPLDSLRSYWQTACRNLKLAEAKRDEGCLFSIEEVASS